MMWKKSAYHTAKLVWHMQTPVHQSQAVDTQADRGTQCDVGTSLQSLSIRQFSVYIICVFSVSYVYWSYIFSSLYIYPCLYICHCIFILICICIFCIFNCIKCIFSAYFPWMSVSYIRFLRKECESCNVWCRQYVHITQQSLPHSEAWPTTKPASRSPSRRTLMSQCEAICLKVAFKNHSPEQQCYAWVFWDDRLRGSSVWRSHDMLTYKCTHAHVHKPARTTCMDMHASPRVRTNAYDHTGDISTKFIW